jgi:hypothetical protein
VKDYAFPQLPVTKAAPVKPAPVKPAPELSPRLLGDLAALCRRESTRAKTIDDYTHLNWIAADLDRRWRKAVDGR